MTPPRTEDDILHDKHHTSKKYLGGLVIIGAIGTIIGVVCGSISILSGFIVAGVLGGLWIGYNRRTRRQ